MRQDTEGNEDQENDKIRQKGMIFTLTETSFPHQFNFMLLEPCSHIFWHFTHSDNKLNLMESRQNKQAFAQILLDSMTNGIFRDLTPEVTKTVEEGYQQIKDQASAKHDDKVGLLMPQTSFEKDWASGKQGELKLIYGLTLEQEEGIFRDIKIFFNANASKFIVTSSNIIDTYLEEQTKKGPDFSKMQAKRGSQASLKSEDKNKKPVIIYEPSDIELQFLLIN